MKLNRRNFLAMAGVVAVVGIVGMSAEAAGELNRVRGKSYVAACPPVKESIPRTPGPQRVMIIGAHPDDADIQCGCTAAKLIAIGDRSKNIAGRDTYLKKYWAASKEKNAVRFADAWREQYPGKPVPKMLEACEISECGRPPIEEDFDC